MTSLAAAVADLRAGRISVEEARDRAAVLPEADEVDAWVADLAALVETVLNTESPALAGDLAAVARAAAGFIADEDLAAVLLPIGQHLWKLKNWSAALPFVSAVAAGSDAGGDPTAAWLQFDILSELGREEEALALAPNVIAQADRDLPMQIAVLAEQARLLRRRGRLTDAIQALEDAAAIRRAVPERDSGAVPPLHDLLLRLGDHARAAGHLDAAIGAFEEARAAALAAGAANRAAFALSELGYAYQNGGEVERGAGLLKTASAEALRLGLLDNAVRWDPGLEGIELSEEEESAATKLQRAVNLMNSDLEAAVALARECVRAGVEMGNSFYEAEARNALAGGLDRLDRPQQAWMAYRAALGAAVRSGDLMAQLHVLGNLADLHLRRVMKSEFDEVSAEAIRVGQEAMRLAGTGETRQIIAAAVARVYDRMAVFAAISYTPPRGSDPVAPDPSRVLEISQRMRGRNLLRWLSVRRYLDSADDADRQAIIALRAADITVEATAGEPGAALGNLIRRRGEAEAALRSRGLGEPAALIADSEPVVFSPGELAAALDPGELLVDVMSLRDQYLVNCVAPDGTVTTSAFNSRQPDRRAALARLRAARETLLAADREGGAPAAEAEYGAAWAALEEMLGDVAEQVAAAGAGVERIYLSPQLELFAFPWWKLAERAGGAEICVIPVPGALPLLRARPPASQPLARLLLIPDATGTLRNANADVARVPHERCDGDVSAVLEALPGASTLHFGGHGHFDAANAYFSGFVVRQAPTPDPLSRPDPARPPRPGMALLTAAQLLARADLPACDLAVLAACRTGVPRQHAANEFTSLPSAMLLAGARAVVASLWNTSDPAAALLMQELYGGLAGGQAPATALASARRILRSLDRDEVIARLGTDEYVPAADRPFARDIYTDPFQYYGVA
jgi:tetratricopeptide (TPR) repeat protein